MTEQALKASLLWQCYVFDCIRQNVQNYSPQKRSNFCCALLRTCARGRAFVVRCKRPKLFASFLQPLQAAPARSPCKPECTVVFK